MEAAKKKKPQGRHRGFYASPETDALIEEHRKRLNARRAGSITTISTTIRNLIYEGAKAVRAREATGK